MYLHNRGLFLASDFSVLLPKSMFLYKGIYVLALSMETMTSLTSPEFNCNSQEEAAQTLDGCLLAEALRAANQSAGCLSKDLG